MYSGKGKQEMYGVKLKNIEEVYTKAKKFIELKNFLDKIISDSFSAHINLARSSNYSHTGNITIKAVLLIPMLQEQIHELGTELKEFGVDLEES